MFWLIIAISAYFLLGLGSTLDKLVVAKFSSTPRVYSFIVGFSRMVVLLVLIPFISWPASRVLFFDFLSGILFVAGLLFFYSALKRDEASRVVPTVDSLVTIFIIILAILFLGEKLYPQQLLAIACLVGGAFLMSKDEMGVNKNSLSIIVLAGLAFGSSLVVAKYVYGIQPFLSAFFWSGIGGFVAVMPMLISKKFRQELRDNFKQGSGGANSKAMAAAQLFGGAGFALQNYAFSLGSASIIGALQGVKYAFLFIFIFLLGKRFSSLHENWSRAALIRKSIALLFIIAGLAILSF